MTSTPFFRLNNINNEKMKKIMAILLTACFIYACKSEKSIPEPTVQEINEYEEKVNNVVDSIALKTSAVEAEIDALLKEQ